MIPVTSDLCGTATIDTQGLASKDRFAFWSETICRHFSPSDNELVGRSADFHARMQRRSLGAIGVSKLSSTPQVSVRSRQSLRRDPLDHFFLSFVQSGRGVMRQGGREAVQEAGDMMLYDSASPFEYRWETDYAGYWVKLPRSLLLNRMPGAEAMTARSIAVTAPVGRLVGNMVEEAYNLDLGDGSSISHRIASTLTELIAAAFEAHAGVDPQTSTRYVSQLDRAKSYILSHLEDGDLNSDTLVRELGVSRRTLTRIFATEGTTPSRWIWQKRLELSHDMLVDGRVRRVTDVALACGFTDISHFSRAFKARFGITAKALLSKSVH